MSNGGTVEEVEAELVILRNAQREHEACRSHAEALVTDAQRAYACARDAELYARREIDQQRDIIDEYDTEINLLLGELRDLLPKPRDPG